MIRWGWVELDWQAGVSLIKTMDLDPYDGLELVVNIDVDPSSPEVGGPATFAHIIGDIPSIPGGIDNLYQWDFDGARPWRYNPHFVNWSWSHRNSVKIDSWPWAFTEFNMFAVSDCYDFPLLPVVGGFAVFNGVDSYIENRSPTVDTTGAWRMEFDVRIHHTGENHLLCKSFNTTRFSKIRLQDITYVGRNIVFGTPLIQDQWHHIDWRYQWDGPDGLYRVSVDGAPDDTAAGSAINVRWNRYSKRGGQVPVGDYDLKNMLFRNGTAISSVVYLDQELQLDACDDGPDGRHGDTFNMVLPSCP